MIQKYFISLIKIIKFLLKKIGIVLISTNKEKLLYKQRDNATKKIVEIFSSNYEKGIEGIVFSKDRAIQLYSLLESYLKFVINPCKLHILYNASNSEHLKTYKELEKIISKKTELIKFCLEENTFKINLMDCISKVRSNNIFFLVDDILFLRSVDFDIVRGIDSSNYTLSLRLSPQLKRSYTARKKHQLPNFRKSTMDSQLLEFSWTESDLEWSNHWSVDGHIFSTAEIKAISEISDFNGPNSYEGILNTFDTIIINRKGLCFEESIILNLPINRVQNEFKNFSGQLSTEMLLSLWNQGSKINIDKFENYIPESTHEEHEIEFTSRNVS